MRIVFALLAAAFAVLPGVVRAADLGGNCCADLEERIAALEAATGRNGSTLTLSGFVGGQKQYVVLDPTSFALEDDALRYIGTDISNILNSALSGQLTPGSTPPPGPMNLGATAPEDQGPPGKPPVLAPSIWSSAFGGRAEYDGRDLSQTDNTFGGGLAGGHMLLAPGIVAGGFAGGAVNQLETERGKTIDTDYFLAGAYGRAVFGLVMLDTSLTGGHAQSQSDREFVTTAPGVPAFQTAHATYDSTYLLPALRLAAYVPLGNGAVLIPAAQARYIWQHFESYDERGSSANLHVGDRDLENVEERLELGVRQTFGLTATQLLTWRASAGFAFYQRIGDRDVDVSVFGTAAQLDPGGPAAETGGFARTGFDLSLAPGSFLFGDAELMQSDDSRALSGSAGLKVEF
jgi:outer membrane autotransporter protein